MSYLLHQHTPTLSAIDPRGLAVRSVAYQRGTYQDLPRARIGRRVFGSQGSQLEQWDPRLHALSESAPASVSPNQRQYYSLSGQLLRTESVDAGWQMSRLGVGGQILERWDARGSHQSYEYDSQLRPLVIFEQAADQPARRCVERLTYAPGAAPQAGLQRCGRLLRHDDPAGALLYEAYGVQGEVIRQSRRFHPTPLTLSWPVAAQERDAQLETDSFVSAWQYDALGQLLEQVDAKGNRQQSSYGADGQLTSSTMLLASGQRQRLVDQCTYDALGQRLSERAGNDLIGLAEYGTADSRLKSLSVYRQGRKKEPLQALSYAYDACGNVVRIQDAAQPVRWGSNTQVNATSTCEYDTLYQLIGATGRENAQASMGAALPVRARIGAVDDGQWRNYRQHYVYDEAGNLKALRHTPSTGSGYTRQMKVADYSNHSYPHQAGVATPGLNSGFDACGNQLELAKGQAMSWNARNQLMRVVQVARGEDGADDDEMYAYDGAGQRVLKRRRARSRARTHIEEVRYLPGLEIRRNTATGEQLNVLISSSGRTRARILQWEHGCPDGLADTQVRLNVSDHLGSCSLELDAQAQVISQETFYPFGGTAWWAARTAVEANYKTVRYSGKERDASGLYYYGFRYYAPWLHRWINPDPAGEDGGLNLYVMVANNPLTQVDHNGQQPSAPETTRLRGGLVLLVLLALIGLLLGSVVAEPWTGATVGAALGAGLFGVGRFAEYWQSRPEVAASLTAQAEAQFGEWVTTRALELAQQHNLSEAETSKLVSFVYERRHGEQGVYMTLSNAAGDSIHGFVGPFEEQARAEGILEGERNPVPSLKRLGFSSVQLRGPAGRQAQSGREASLSQFEVAGPSRLARQPRAGASPPSPSPLSTQPARLASAMQPLNIDTSVLDALNLGPAERSSIAQTISHVRARRFAAVGWHPHRDRRWSADLYRYPGTTRRGAYRLMFEHRGGNSYKVTGIRNPHR